MSTPVSEFTISIDQVDGYEFRIKFDKPQYPDLLTDEPAPLGRDSAPSPARILAAAAASCLSASFLFCARKNGANVKGIHTEARVEIVRTGSRRLRVGKIEVRLEPDLDEADREKAQRCLGTFEDFCIVTQSVRQGVPVDVTVKGFEGAPAA